jgi:lysophospholipase L1-like esterase
MVMSKTKKVLSLVLLGILLSLGIGLYNLRSMGRAEYWESTIREFEKADRIAPPKPDVIVFTGSSSIAFWRTLRQDMYPLVVVNRGFGGAQISHVSYYADRIILPYRPRAVVLYAGVDDLIWGGTPETVLSDFQHFVGLIHAALPETWIYFISIKPTRLFGSHWAAMNRTNALIEEFVHTQPKVEFIDVSTALLDVQGKARPEFLSWDGLHPSRQGYELMTSRIKPVLLGRFLNDQDTGRSNRRQSSGVAP